MRSWQPQWRRGLFFTGTVSTWMIFGFGAVLLGWLVVRTASPERSWASVLSEERLIPLATNSLVATLIALAVALPAATLLGFLLFRTDLPGRCIAKSLLLLAAALPAHVVSTAWLDIGEIRGAGGSISTLGLIHAINYLPLATLLIGVGLRGAASRAEEVALLDGAHPWQVALQNARAAARAIAAVGVLIATWTLTDYTASDLLLIRTLAEEIYSRFALDANIDAPLILATPMLGLLLIAFLLLARTSGQWFARHSETPHVFLVRRARALSSFAVVATPGALAVGPMIGLLYRGAQPDLLLRTAQELWPEIRVSVTCATAAAAITAIVGPRISWWLVHSKAKGTPRLAAILSLTWVGAFLALPAPLLAIGMIHLLNRSGLPGQIYDSPAVLILAYVLRFLPVAVLVIMPTMLTLAREVIENARIDGARSTALYRDIGAPQVRLPRATAAIVVAILSLGELPASLLLTPPGYDTVSARYASMVHYGLYSEAAALCLLSTVVLIGPVVILIGMLRAASTRAKAE